MREKRAGVVLEHEVLAREEGVRPRSPRPWPREQRALQPASVGQDIDDRWKQHQRDKQLHTLFARDTSIAMGIVAPARRRVGEREHGDRSQQISARPLGGDSGAARDPRTQQPWSRQESVRGRVATNGSVRFALIAVVEEAEERQEPEQDNEDVEHRGARHHEVEEVEREEPSGNGGGQGRAEQTARQQVQHRDAQRTRNQRHDPPPAGSKTEQSYAGSDQPLSQGRMDDADLGRGSTVTVRTEHVEAGVGRVELVEHKSPWRGDAGDSQPAR